MKNIASLPQLNVSDTPTIGFPLAGVHSEKQISIADEIQLMREILEQQSRLIVDIYTRVYTPWYSRLWNWIRRGF